MIAEVVFHLPISRGFDYLIPEAWGVSVQPGMRVLAPFGARRLVGYVVDVRASSRIRHLKPLLRRIDDEPLITPVQQGLAQQTAQAYACTRGEVYANMLPAALRVRSSPPQESTAPEHESPPTLTSQQAAVFDAFRAAIVSRRPHTFLLHGVTGSGKTELYLRVIAEALAQGRGGICLVPEIAMTPQTIDRFRRRFGDEVVLWHSRLTARQRGEAWGAMKAGSRRVVVGTRSAVFAPLAAVGCLILDEEHDPSYKQDQTPRYHARDVALARARLEGAVVILGSATPSVESYYEAQRRTYRLVCLTERINQRPMPKVEVIDMRDALAHRHRAVMLSDRLSLALRRAVESQEQAILFLNRRGFARVAQCPACGAVRQCHACSTPMIYHATRQQLLCHYCNRSEPLGDTCPSCDRGYLRLRGLGTERVESELHRLFPGISVARMDTDAMAARESHRRLYDAMTSQQVGVLVGTQMVAKGLDLPQVTFVGVISADTSLNLPDFRAGEHTFDLLTQVAGRAGRGERPGRVLIQTYCPTHYAIQAASHHDYEAFYRAEIAMRQRLGLPPCLRLIELTVQGRKAETVERAAETLTRALKQAIGRRRIHLLGPAPHRVAMVRKTIRWRLVLKARRVAPMLEAIRAVLGETRHFHGCPVVIDVDPL